MAHLDCVIKVYQKKSQTPYHEHDAWCIQSWWNRDNAIDACLAQLGSLRHAGLSEGDRLEIELCSTLPGDPIYTFRVVVAYAGQFGLTPVYTNKKVKETPR